jgi:Ca2+:H+ antiporter
VEADEKDASDKRCLSTKDAWPTFGLLLVSLIAVAGLAKTSSGQSRTGSKSIGAPQSAVGVVIALLVLMPESHASVPAFLRSPA